jgi:putative oxidoreductase
MASSNATSTFGSQVLSRTRSTENASSKYVLLAGRILFSGIFIMSGFMHFSSKDIGYAIQAGVPMASFLVPASGVIAAVGGLSILLGYRARVGAWLLVLFLVPVTVMMHNFWVVKDPMMAQIQIAMFLKNLTMLGAALIIAYFGSGPMSLDAHQS